jgi:hypothetical protein
MSAVQDSASSMADCLNQMKSGQKPSAACMNMSISDACSKSYQDSCTNTGFFDFLYMWTCATLLPTQCDVTQAPSIYGENWKTTCGMWVLNNLFMDGGEKMNIDNILGMCKLVSDNNMQVYLGNITGYSDANASSGNNSNTAGGSGGAGVNGTNATNATGANNGLNSTSTGENGTNITNTGANGTNATGTGANGTTVPTGDNGTNATGTGANGNSSLNGANATNSTTPPTRRRLQTTTQPPSTPNTTGSTNSTSNGTAAPGISIFKSDPTSNDTQSNFTQNDTNAITKGIMVDNSTVTNKMNTSELVAATQAMDPKTLNNSAITKLTNENAPNLTTTNNMPPTGNASGTTANQSQSNGSIPVNSTGPNGTLLGSNPTNTSANGTTGSSSQIYLSLIVVLLGCISYLV